MLCTCKDCKNKAEIPQRDNWIQSIDSMFPIDSPYEKTNEIGRRLLIESIEESDWRLLPDEILVIYAQKCLAEDNRQTNELLDTVFSHQKYKYVTDDNEEEYHDK